MAEPTTATALLESGVNGADHVLLVNPPVEETRYNWIRWNQPVDLLKIAAHLREEIGCTVSLLDFMKPDQRGRVPWQRLPGSRAIKRLGGHNYPMRRYGLPYSELTKTVTEWKERGRMLPTQVWVTSLCSHWLKGVAQVCREARTALPEATVVAIGNYPRLLNKHAAETCPADFVAEGCVDLDATPPALDLYGDRLPPFLGLRLHSCCAAEVAEAVEKGVTRFAVFEEDVLQADGEPLRRLLQDTADLHRHLRYHLICGIHPERITSNLATFLAKENVAELYLEEDGLDGTRSSESRGQAASYLREAGFGISRKRLGAFVWIGEPEEDLEGVIGRALNALAQVGSFIFKPYTPTPGGSVHKQYFEQLSPVPLQDCSPHFFPFAELNGIHRNEYHDLYRMAAFLNNRIRGRTFDFLEGTIGAELLRSSLEREVWRIEPSAKRASH